MYLFDGQVTSCRTREAPAMSNSNVDMFGRRIGRRRLFQVGGTLGAGLLGAALIGCSSDDDDDEATPTASATGTSSATATTSPDPSLPPGERVPAMTIVHINNDTWTQALR